MVFLRKFSLLFLFVSTPIWLLAQISRQPDYSNALKAKAILDQAIDYSGLGSDSLNMVISAKGVMHESGHFSAPEERIDVPETYTLSIFSSIENYYIDGQINFRGRNLTRQVYVKQDSIFYRDHFGRGVSREALIRSIPVYNEILALHPALILNEARRSLLSLRYLGKVGAVALLSFSTNQTSFTLHILPNGQVKQVSYLASHNYYGDNVHRYDYLDYKPIAGYNLPTRFNEYEFGGLRKDLTFTYDFAPTLTLPVNQVCPGCSLVPKRKNANITVKNLGGDLYSVDLNAYNNRSLFLVAKNGVTVFEAPVSYKAGRDVIEAVNQTTGGKPITQLMVTHHHPDHAGGLRAFAEQGATIITTKGNVKFFSQLVNYPHQLEGRTSDKQLKPSFITVDSAQTFTTNTEEPFTLYFIGDTQHTNEYLVAYFPKQKILFQGDLCFFQLNGESAASAREQAIGRLIERKKLAVERIYSSWPLRGFKEFGTAEDLKRKLELATK